MQTLTDYNSAQLPAQLGSFYEHQVFMRILQRSAFLSDSSCGPVHRDLWQCITIPCLAVVATNVSYFTVLNYVLTISMP